MRNLSRILLFVSYWRNVPAKSATLNSRRGDLFSACVPGLRLKWGKFQLNTHAVFNTYAYAFDKNGNVVVGDRTEWSYGRFGRYQGMSKNLSYTFNNQSFKKLKEAWAKLWGKDVKDDEEDADVDDDDDGEPGFRSSAYS